MDRLNQTHGRGRTIEFYTRTVEQVSFEAITRKRIDFLIQELPKKAEQQKWLQRDWTSYMKNYENYLFREHDANDLTQYVDKVHSFFGQNHRAKVQLAQLTYYDFLRKEKFQKHYTLVERMCKGGFKYPMKPIYAVDQAGMIKFSNERIYDNVFLPNIFHFPYCVGQEMEKKGHAGTCVLAGVRIMQIMRVASSIRKEANKDPAVNCGEITRLLSDVFLYDEILLSNMILLYSDYEIIAMGGIPFTTSEVKNYSLSPMPKLDRILDMLMSDVAYLNMCAMRLPLRQHYISEEHFFFALCLEDIDLSLWSARQIHNALNLFRILREVNSVEKKQVNNRLSQITNYKHRRMMYRAMHQYALFEFCSDKVRDKLIDQVMAIEKKIPERREYEDLMLRLLR